MVAYSEPELSASRHSLTHLLKLSPQPIPAFDLASDEVELQLPDDSLRRDTQIGGHGIA